MLLIKLAYENGHDISKEIQQVRLFLKQRDMSVTICDSMEENVNISRIYCSDDSYDNKLQSLVDLYCSNIIYRTVIKEYRDNAFLAYITDNYFFLDNDEIIELEKKTMSILLNDGRDDNGYNVFCVNIVNNILNKIKDCITEMRQINIEGFIRFRMKDISQDIEKVVDKVVEDFMVEKEYNEFIKLLKYFVEIQESRMSYVNIILQGHGEFRILDENGKDVFMAFTKELSDVKINEDTTMEDILISGLIMNCPKKIVIHNTSVLKNKEFIDTITKVFGDRVSFVEDKGNEILVDKAKI